MITFPIQFLKGKCTDNRHLIFSEHLCWEVFKPKYTILKVHISIDVLFPSTFKQSVTISTISIHMIRTESYLDYLYSS